MSEVCNNLSSILGGVGGLILFVFSEVLPFIKSVKYNGLAEALYEETKKRVSKNQNEDPDALETP